MIIITARSDFDDRDTFLDTFRQQGIDIDDVHVHRSGNLDAPNSAAGKKIVIKQYLETGKYARVRLFDDAISNLDMLLGLKTEYPDIDFEAYLAHHDGTMTRYRK
jgi:Mg2+/Co2+ transporter CorB